MHARFLPFLNSLYLLIFLKTHQSHANCKRCSCSYAQSKVIAEHRLARAATQGRIRLVIARLGLIGDPQSPGLETLSAPSLMQSPSPKASTLGEAFASCPSTEAVSSGSRVSSSACWEALGARRDWLSLVLCAVAQVGAVPAGLASRHRGVAVLPVDLAASALAEAARSRPLRAAALDTCSSSALNPTMRASSGANDAESESNESDTSVTEHKRISPRNITVVHMDAGAFGLRRRIGVQ